MAVVPASVAELIASMEPEMRDAFLEAIADATDTATVTAIAERLQAGDLEGAVALIDVSTPVFSRVADLVDDAYRAAAVLTAEAARAVINPQTGARLVVRFDARAPAAEEWLRQTSSSLVKGLSRTALQTVRAALSDGMAAGRNPRQTALDVVGRISKTSGRREGGVVGLTPAQWQYSVNARNELLSGDPVLLRRYLGRKMRDARHDAKVRRAMASGEPVPAEQVDQMINRYRDRLLKWRGDNIARTETLASVHAGQYEATRQMIETGKVDEQDVVTIWRTNMDGRQRDAHALLNGRKVRPGQVFVSPITGSKMRHPGDRSLGAGAADVAQCRCHAEYQIDFVKVAVRRARQRQAAA